MSFLFITCLVSWLVATSFCGRNGALAWGRAETKLVSETRISVAMASAKDRGSMEMVTLQRNDFLPCGFIQGFMGRRPRERGRDGF